MAIDPQIDSPSSSSSSSSLPTTSSGHGADTGHLLFGRYELGRLLGRGGSAKVYLARDLRSDTHVALKVFSKSAKSSSMPANSSVAVREISLMRKLHHRHVLRLTEVLASRSKIYLVLELAHGGELFTRVESRGKLPEECARKYFKQLISAIRYCHARGVFHRDLKPENILLDENGDLKIADFGLGTLSTQTQNGLFRTICGTPAYVAPEILAKKEYDASKVDVWSCGIILYVLAAGYLPFNHPNLMTMYKKIYRAEFRFPKWISPGLRSLISRMLDPNPETRITVEGVDGITSHPWFLSGIDAAEWTAEMRSHEDMFKLEDKQEEKRAPNAFDIISFSAGCDLSRIFDTGVSVRERFFMAEATESVLRRAEDAGKQAGMGLRRVGEGGLVIEGRKGSLMASVEVCCVREGLSMVEVLKGDGDGTSQKLFWKEILGPALNRPV